MAEKTAKSERQFPRSITLDNNTITSNGGHGVYIGSNVSS